MVKSGKTRKQQKPRETATGQWLYCNFSARPEEIAAWKALAKADRRSLSSWIREVLVKHTEIQDRIAKGGSYDNNNSQSQNRDVDVAPVSADRA